MEKMTLTPNEVELLRRLTEEFEFWPGTGETPNGVQLSEEDDGVLWQFIRRLNSAS